MKKKNIMILLSVAVVCIAATVIAYQTAKHKENAQDDLPITRTESNLQIFSNEEELYETADLIVIGFVKTDLVMDASEYKKTVGSEFLRTDTTFYIDKVLKGEYDKQTLNVVEAIGIVEYEGVTRKVAVDQYDELKKDNIYILYLDIPPDQVVEEYKFQPDSYRPLGVYQGVVKLTGEVRREAHGSPGYYERMTKLKNGAIDRFHDDIKEVTGLEFPDTPKQ